MLSMLDLLLQRSTIISLAVIGGVLSLVVSWGSGSGKFSPSTLKRINMAAYGFMIASMVLFVGVGFFGSR